MLGLMRGVVWGEGELERCRDGRGLMRFIFMRFRWWDDRRIVWEFGWVEREHWCLIPLL
jgi:hypothetical protein